MKAIAYNIKTDEKENLILANHKKHDITIIANSLCLETLKFAQGKEVLIVFNEDTLEVDLIKGLKEIGIKYIANSTSQIKHINIDAIKEEGLKLANVPLINAQQHTLDRMKQIIANLDNWSMGICLGEACCTPKNCENTVLLTNRLC